MEHHHHDVTVTTPTAARSSPNVWNALRHALRCNLSLQQRRRYIERKAYVAEGGVGVLPQQFFNA